MAVITGAVVAVGTAAYSANRQKAAASKAGRRQRESLEQSQATIEAAADRAREDALPRFEQAREDVLMGFQGALDVFGQTIPQQAMAFQAGNVGAQQQLIAGLPQIQAAILGQPVDFSALQPTEITMTEESFAPFRQLLPEFRPPTAEEIAAQEAEAAAMAENKQASFGLWDRDKGWGGLGIRF